MIKYLWYILNFFATILNYGIRRGMGILVIPLSASMGVQPGSLMILSSIIEWTKSLILIFSSFLDRYPLSTYVVGILSYVTGITLMSFSTTSYYAMIGSVIVMACGHALLLLGVANFVNRSEGYGRTWDSLTIGIALSCSPLLTALVFRDAKGVDLIDAFAIYGIISFFVFTGIALLIQNGKVNYRPANVSLNVFSYWKLNGLWRMSFVMIMMSGVIYFVGANFTLVFKSHGVKTLEAVLIFAGIWATIGTIGRFFWTWLGHRYIGIIRPATVVALSFTLVGVLIFPYNLYTTIIGCCLLAFGTAAGQVMVIPNFGERWGHEIFSSIWGLISIIYNLINGCLILLSGYLMNITNNNFVLVYQLYSFMAILAIVLFVTEKNVEYKEPVNGYKELNWFK